VTIETFVRLVTPQPWMTHAACKHSGARFFPSETRTSRVSAEQYAAAVKVCRTCPVIEECREYGRDERFGVWGGTTPADRSPRMVAPQRPPDCGTWQGYHKHTRRGETACERCLDAYRVYRHEHVLFKRDAS
jgi:WhiB family transcriptional regulator, redox-sensing transcriptional regulator